jgi:hypothetical protein
MRLIFSLEDLAQAIADYYRRYLREPLKRELEEGHGGLEILKYFTTDELRAPAFGKGHADDSEAAWNEAAGKLALSFDKVTPKKVQADVEKVFAEHEKDTDHINSPDTKLRPEDRKWRCSHQSELVKLSYGRKADETQPAMFLSPVRGYDAAEHVIEPGWNIVAFPQYLVSEAE